jgi:hypothetical protein
VRTATVTKQKRSRLPKWFRDLVLKKGAHSNPAYAADAAAAAAYAARRRVQEQAVKMVEAMIGATEP